VRALLGVVDKLDPQRVLAIGSDAHLCVCAQKCVMRPQCRLVEVWRHQLQFKYFAIDARRSEVMQRDADELFFVVGGRTDVGACLGPLVKSAIERPARRFAAFEWYIYAVLEDLLDECAIGRGALHRETRDLVGIQHAMATTMLSIWGHLVVQVAAVAAELSLVSRIVLAYVAFFRILFQGAFARDVRALARTEAREKPRAQPPAEAPAAASPAAASPALAAGQEALALLSLLQQEGRLVDFLEQDIDAFDDADVGSAARLVHVGCRKVLRSRATVRAVRDEAEGARVRLEVGFNAAENKLVGNVRGAAPYSGVLRHRGWRIDGLKLPERTADNSIVAAAEIEL
jgi:hypothetical protein